MRKIGQGNSPIISKQDEHHPTISCKLSEVLEMIHSDITKWEEAHIF